MEQRYVSPKQFVRRFPIARSTIYALIARGEIQAIRIGGRLLIPVSEVQRLEAQLGGKNVDRSEAGQS